MGQRIDVNHLNIYYGDFLAVEDVNINIEANKVTAFIGPSGCGKSTVLRTLDRMHEIIPGAHCEGEVLLEGKNLYDKDIDPVAVRRDVGMVFQRANPFPTMSIRENVLAGVRLNNRKISKSDADDLVEWALRGANLWNEVKDRLDNPGIGHHGQSTCALQRFVLYRKAVSLFLQKLLQNYLIRIRCRRLSIYQIIPPAYNAFRVLFGRLFCLRIFRFCTFCLLLSVLCFVSGILFLSCCNGLQSFAFCCFCFLTPYQHSCQENYQNHTERHENNVPLLFLVIKIKHFLHSLPSYFL